MKSVGTGNPIILHYAVKVGESTLCELELQCRVHWVSIWKVSAYSQPSPDPCGGGGSFKLLPYVSWLYSVSLTKKFHTHKVSVRIYVLATFCAGYFLYRLLFVLATFCACYFLYRLLVVPATFCTGYFLYRLLVVLATFFAGFFLYRVLFVPATCCAGYFLCRLLFVPATFCACYFFCRLLFVLATCCAG